jgi:hypothetical protein
MKQFAGFLAVSLAAVLAIGCDSATPAPAPEPAKADGPQSIAKTGSRLAPKKKKKELGIDPAPRGKTVPRPDL